MLQIYQYCTPLKWKCRNICENGEKNVKTRFSLSFSRWSENRVKADFAVSCIGSTRYPWRGVSPRWHASLSRTTNASRAKSSHSSRIFLRLLSIPMWPYWSHQSSLICLVFDDGTARLYKFYCSVLYSSCVNYTLMLVSITSMEKLYYLLT